MCIRCKLYDLLIINVVLCLISMTLFPTFATLPNQSIHEDNKMDNNYILLVKHDDRQCLLSANDTLTDDVRQAAYFDNEHTAIRRAGKLGLTHYAVQGIESGDKGYVLIGHGNGSQAYLSAINKGIPTWTQNIKHARVFFSPYMLNFAASDSGIKSYTSHVIDL